jgi:hypothetical protein
MDNYDTLELILSLVHDFKKLVKMSRVNKTWLYMIRTEKVIWIDMRVSLEMQIYDKHLLYPIKNLKLRNNKNITKEKIKDMNLIYLDCGMNNNVTDEWLKELYLETLLCGSNTVITNKGIKHLKLKKLDCGKNNNISDDGLSETIELLNCGKNNKITDLGVHKLKLKKLYCGENKKITDKGIIDLPLDTLQCNHNITDLGIGPNIRRLYCAGNTNITDNIKITLMEKGYDVHD